MHGSVILVFCIKRRGNKSISFCNPFFRFLFRKYRAELSLYVQDIVSGNQRIDSHYDDGDASNQSDRVNGCRCVELLRIADVLNLCKADSGTYKGNNDSHNLLL